jgi:hypothetical protein
VIHWRPAHGGDVPAIVAMAVHDFECEIDTIFTPDPVAYSRNITLAVVNQFYLPMTELVSVAVTDSGELLAYTWARRNERAPWSDDEMVVVRMAHLNLALSARLRVRLVNDMIDLWETFAAASGVPIICSTTMRGDQSAFLRIHARRGYDVRGSYAYRRLPQKSPDLIRA